MRSIAQILGFAGGILFLADDARSATIQVPGDYSTVYAALDAASSGDIVEVAPGTYDQFDTRPLWAGDNVSSVGFLKDGVVLKSSGGAAVTTLRMDTSTARPAVLFGGEGEMHVEGFTLTGSLAELTAISIQTPDNETGSLILKDCVIGDFGFGDPTSHESAMDAYNAEVHIQGCLIENIDSPAAVAVFCYGGNALVEDTSFKNCSGGGIHLAYLDFDELLTVRRSTFENNGGPGPPYVGAVSANAFGLLVEDSWFFQNSLGINFNCGVRGYVGSVNVVVRNNTFAGGPGICASSNLGEFSGNTFYGGSGAIHYFGYGGGSSVLLERNVISFSTGGPAVEIAFEAGGSVTTGCNVFWQNQGGHTQGFSMGPTDLVADPQFCNAAALNFTVNGASPCLPQNNNGCGQIGAWGLGCGPVSVEPSSWGQIKALYR